MADRTSPRERLVAKISSLTDLEVAELLDYVTIMENMRAQEHSPSSFEDDLLALLSDADRRKLIAIADSADRPRRRADRSTFVSWNPPTYIS